MSYAKQVTGRPPLTREERHWRGVRRSAWGMAVFFGCGGLVALSDYLAVRPLGIVAAIGGIAAWCYVAWSFVDVFKAWFLKNG